MLVSCSKGLGELWNRRMDHLHHEVCNLLREMVMGLPEMKIEQHEVYKGCTLGKYPRN